MTAFTSRSVRLFILAIAACAALALAGCGATDAVDKQDYIKKINKIQTDAVGSMNKMDVNDPASLKAASGSITKAADEMDDLEVPKDYTTEHKQMVGALRELASVMEELEGAAKAKDTAKLQELITRLDKSQKDFTEAIDSMNKDLA